MKKTGEKLSLLTRIGYGMGDLYGGGAMTIIGFYYLYFLTDVVRISPSLAGVVFLVSKIYDAVTDPIMGMISDRTRTRFGRRRPYFLAGVILIVISFFMMWYPVAFESEALRFLYVILAYIFYSTIITMVMVPYNALPAELTADYNERTSLATFRMVFSGIAGILCAVLPLEIVKAFGDQRTGYMVMALCFGLFFGLPYILTFLATYERDEFQGELPPWNLRETVRTTFIEPFRVRSFRGVLMMYIFAFISMDSLMAVMIYFVTYYLKMQQHMTVVLGALFVVQIAFLPVFDYISRVTSKRAGYMMAVGIWMVAMCFSFFLGPDSSMVIVYFFAGCLGVASAGFSVLVFAMFPDIPDVDELRSGERREGVYSGLFTFMRKASSAVALFLISNSLYLAGYRKPEQAVVDGVTRLVEQPQTDEFILMLRLIFVLAPIVFLSIGLYQCVRYPLSPELHRRLAALLEKRRSGTRTPELAREEEYLKKTLI